MLHHDTSSEIPKIICSLVSGRHLLNDFDSPLAQCGTMAHLWKPRTANANLYSLLVATSLIIKLSSCEREREIHYVHSASLAYEDGIVFMSFLQQGNETMADRLLVLVPHEHTHAPRSILEQAGKLGPDVTEMRAIPHTMELIAHSLCIANGAVAKVALDGWPGK